MLVPSLFHWWEAIQTDMSLQISRDPVLQNPDEKISKVQRSQSLTASIGREKASKICIGYPQSDKEQAQCLKRSARVKLSIGSSIG